MTDHVFFYGTLMTGFNRPGRQRVDSILELAGRGRIRAALFDLGIYPAAVPSDDDSTVRGEVYHMRDVTAVLSALDEIEGFRPNEPERSLYLRVLHHRHPRRWPRGALRGRTSTTHRWDAPSASRRATTSNI